MRRRQGLEKTFDDTTLSCGFDSVNDDGAGARKTWLRRVGVNKGKIDVGAVEDVTAPIGDDLVVGAVLRDRGTGRRAS